MSLPTLNLDRTAHNRPAQLRVRIKIPHKYHQNPIVSHLASNCHLEVNILAALLGSNGAVDGWFDLELRGESQNIDAALIYLADLDLEVWYDSGTEIDGW